jgi:hypothetical protein
MYCYTAYMETILFIGALILLGVCIIATVFTIVKGRLPKKLRNIELKVLVDEIITDYGDLSHNDLIGTTTIRLLQCRKKEKIFFVLEVSQKFVFEPNTYWIPIDEKELEKLATFLPKNHENP